MITTLGIPGEEIYQDKKELGKKKKRKYKKKGEKRGGGGKN